MYQLEEEVVWKPLEQVDVLNNGIEEKMCNAGANGFWKAIQGFLVVDKETRLAIEICDEESENNINGEENIDNVVNNEESVFLKGGRGGGNQGGKKMAIDKGNDASFPAGGGGGGGGRIQNWTRQLKARTF
ncbi:hypothetical protein LINPERPRIM_LOCUS6994 [Linum perenne]